MKGTLDKLGVERTGGQIPLFWKVNGLQYGYLLQSTFLKLVVTLGCSFVIE